MKSILLTCQDNTDSVLIAVKDVEDLTKLELYQYAVKHLPVAWEWDDDMQLVYYPNPKNKNVYFLCNCD